MSDVSDYKDKTLSLRLDNRFTDRDSITLGVTHKTHKWYDDHADGLYNNVSFSYNFKEGTTTPSWIRYFNNYKSTWIQDQEHPSMKMQGIEYQNGWEIGQHKIISGLEYHENKATDTANGYDNVRVRNKAFYIQDTIKLGKKWHVIPGIRYDHSDEFGNSWSPKLQANYRADDKTKIYASWGRVYRTPSLAELYTVSDLTHFYGNKFVLAHGGVNKLKSEKGHTETVGIEHNFNDNVSVALNLFYTKLGNAIVWNGSPAPYYDRYGNIVGYQTTRFPSNSDSQKRRGIEISFNQKIDDHFSYNLGYSHTKIDSVREHENFMQPNGYRVGFSYKNRGLHVNLFGIMASGLSEQTQDFVGFASDKYAIF